MHLAEMSEHSQHRSPDTQEENNDQQCDLPFGNRHSPEESPVTTIGLHIKLEYNQGQSSDARDSPLKASNHAESQMPRTKGQVSF